MQDNEISSRGRASKLKLMTLGKPILFSKRRRWSIFVYTKMLYHESQHVFRFATVAETLNCENVPWESS